MKLKVIIQHALDEGLGRMGMTCLALSDYRHKPEWRAHKNSIWYAVVNQYSAWIHANYPDAEWIDSEAHTYMDERRHALERYMQEHGEDEV